MFCHHHHPPVRWNLWTVPKLVIDIVQQVSLSHTRLTTEICYQRQQSQRPKDRKCNLQVFYFGGKKVLENAWTIREASICSHFLNNNSLLQRFFLSYSGYCTAKICTLTISWQPKLQTLQGSRSAKTEYYTSATSEIITPSAFPHTNHREHSMLQYSIFRDCWMSLN